MKDTLEELAAFGVVPVVVLNREEDAESLAGALVRGGLKCAEVTFRTKAAASAIRIMTEKFPEMLVGAGTVLSISQVDAAVAAGGKFIVSPGFDPEVVDYCLDKGIPVLPGVATPTEAAQGVKRNLRMLKFFPAEQAGGLAMIKAMAAPFTTLRFIPTGGINANNLPDYLGYDRIAACGGSWMVKSSLIDAGDFDAIEKLTREAVELVHEIREAK
ncbi:MAG: bifunctional 4-hydroxy-2-oxoglutarate aldolase/2-dehydro-3-deoxy-phosphogluconate aldolase [Lachnospiraceae bacterium]|nr:bifunctional 4-hydroxy-2-oxoglutarate aldolase/2-dehydro-3-deoxy-phosphogluconate aldolase [Lachnospiraceae bacterium]